MKESALFRKVVGEKLLNQDSIQERAIATAKATLLQSDSKVIKRSKTDIGALPNGKAANGVINTEEQNKPRNRRLILSIDMLLVAVVVGLVVIIASDLIHPTWMPIWLGGNTTTTTATTTNSTTISTTTATSGTTVPKPTFPSIQDSGLLEGIPWSEYSKAKIHQAEINLTLQEKRGFGIQLIDEEQNLYLDVPKDDSYGATGLKYPDSTSELYIYNLTDGTYQSFAQASSHKVDLVFLAEDEKYIVWRETTQREVESIDPVYHVYVRETREDIAFTIPITDYENEADHSVSSIWPVVLLKNTVYLDVLTKVTNGSGTLQDLYRFDIVSRTLEPVESNAARPFLYHGELAWFHLDNTYDKATPMTANGVIAGLPVLTAVKLARSTIFNDILITFDPTDVNSLTMIRNGVSVPIVAGRNFFDIRNPHTNGTLVAFSIYESGRSMVYDVGRMMLVEMTDLPKGAQFRGFFENRMVFVDMADNTGDLTFHSVMYWIDLDEMK